MKEIQITYKEKTLDGIPLIECYKNDNLPKTLCFINHGFTSNKGEGTYFMMFEMAKLGLHVVSIDAYKHGDRIEEPLISGSEAEQIEEIFDYIIQTGKDIKYLYNHYYKDQYDQCLITGISMGGAVTYYAGSIIKEAKWLVPMIGFPSFYDFGQEDYKRNGLMDQEKLSYLKRIKSDDPMYNIELFDGKEILILNGIKDDLVPIKYARTFFEKLTKRQKSSVTMKEFPVHHEVPVNMREVVYDYVKSHVTGGRDE